MLINLTIMGSEHPNESPALSNKTDLELHIKGAKIQNESSPDSLEKHKRTQRVASTERWSIGAKEHWKNTITVRDDA